jgi:hypothetical protein
MTKAQQYLTERNITPTKEILDAMSYVMSVGYSTSVMGISTTTLEDLQRDWFTEEKKENN